MEFFFQNAHFLFAHWLQIESLSRGFLLQIIVFFEKIMLLVSDSIDLLFDGFLI